jgi:hypothetical protein
LISLPWLPTQASSFTFLPSFLPQQLINVALLLSIIRITIFLLSHPTQPHSTLPCIPCTTSINLLPKRIKSSALINERGDWINFKAMISDSSIHKIHKQNPRCLVTEQPHNTNKMLSSFVLVMPKILSRVMVMSKEN